MDPYQVLGLERNAGEKEVKTAYRRLSFQYHPDRNPSEEAKPKMVEINNAYEILSDAEKRRMYDMTGSVSGGDGGGGGGGGHPGGGQHFQFHFGGGGPGGPQFFHAGGPGMPGMPGNIFEQFFGGGGIPGAGNPFEHLFRRFTVPQKPATLEKVLELTLDQIFTGVVQYNIPVERTITVFDPPNTIGDRNFIHEEKTEVVQLRVDIPAGIQPEEVMVVGGEGHQWRPYHQTAMEPLPSVAKGDILLKIVVLEHAEYKRKGMDLMYKKKISLREALCGLSFMLPGIGNRESVKCHCDVVIKPGMNKVCPGLGFRREGVVGNLVIEFDVEFPATISEEQRAWLSAHL